MKLAFAALLLLAITSTTSAYADAVVNGTVSVTYPGTGTTSASGSGSVLNLAVGTPQVVNSTFSTLDANVGPTSGSVTVKMSSMFVPPAFTTSAAANYTLNVNGFYELTGGTGTGLATWTIDALKLGSGIGGWTGCSITLAGVTEICNLGTDQASGSFLVPFNTPLDLSFMTSFSGFASLSDGELSTLTYNIGLSPVPEPGTVWLLGAGLLFLAIPAANWTARIRQASN